MERLPVIALVGRPNVGKSTLFNRLTRTRDALVADVPGLTRDRHYAPASFDGRRVVLIDTGGFEPVRSEGVAALMAQQTRQAILEADLVVLVTDGRQGLAPRDLEIANELRRATRHVLVTVNKTEGMRSDISVAEFHRLGLGEPVAISSAHGDGVADLVDEALARLADRFPAPAVVDDWAGVDADSSDSVVDAIEDGAAVDRAAGDALDRAAGDAADPAAGGAADGAAGDAEAGQ
ncbi:MAG: GTPase, partial [Burkholderiaceae bacterium]